MTDYKKYLSIKNKDDVGTFRQDIDSIDHKNEDINDLLYSNNSIPGQPNKQKFMDPYIGINIPEYESFEDKENEAKEMEKECSEDPNRDMYIKKGESIESNNTNAGYKYDTNPMKAYEEDFKYYKKTFLIPSLDGEETKLSFDFITQKEKDTANYILGKYGAKAQAEYLENLAYRLRLREGEHYAESLKNKNLFEKGKESLLNGFSEKVSNAIQGVVSTGENKNVFLPSAQSIGIDYYKDEYANGLDKVVINSADWLGQTAASAAATTVNPAFGFAFNSAADYGDEYKNSLMGVSPNGGKDDIQKAEGNASGNMVAGMIPNLLFSGIKVPFEIPENYLKIYPAIDNVVFPMFEQYTKDKLAPQYKYDKKILK